MAITVTPTLDEVLTKVRVFLLSIVPPGTPVLLGPINRVAQPAVPHTVFTPLLRNRLRTNVHEDNSVTQETTTEEGVKAAVQFDFYGEKAGDWSAAAETLWRDEYAYDILSPEAVPLYTDTANMVPLVTGEDQFLERFVLTVTLQWNVRVTVAQQSANALDYELVNVDERFPPV